MARAGEGFSRPLFEPEVTVGQMRGGCTSLLVLKLQGAGENWQMSVVGLPGTDWGTGISKCSRSQVRVGVERARLREKKVRQEVDIRAGRKVRQGKEKGSLGAAPSPTACADFCDCSLTSRI